MDDIARTRELIKQAGGPGVVGKLFDISGQAVSAWYAEGIPAHRVIPICQSTGWALTPNALRPDIYPHPEDGLPAEMRAQAQAAE